MDQIKYDFGPLLARGVLPDIILWPVVRGTRYIYKERFTKTLKILCTKNGPNILPGDTSPNRRGVHMKVNGTSYEYMYVRTYVCVFFPFPESSEQ